MKSGYSTARIENRFQVAAFHANFKVRMSDSKTPVFEAFALAIVCTSDDAVLKIIEKNPNAMQQWDEVRKFERLKNYKRNKIAKDRAREKKRRLLNVTSESNQETINEACHGT